MAVKVHIHATHRQYTNGLEVVEVTGRTVGECLHNLIKQYPGMEKALFAKKDKLLNIVEVMLIIPAPTPMNLLNPLRTAMKFT